MQGIVIMWDHRDQPSWDEVTAAARRGFTFFREVEDTGGDNFAVVASQHAIDTEEQAQAIFDAVMEEEQS